MGDGRQRVLITAGASGIGLAMARAFSEAGARVWITDINDEYLASCPAEWLRDRVDVSDPAAMERLFARVRTEWQGLDTLCANAGTAGPTALIEDQPVDAFGACIAVNVQGAFLATQGALRLMKPAGGGSLVYTSSTAGLYGFPYRAPYAAAKWAIHGLMKTAAMEAGPFGIRANAIAPGCVEGPRIDGVIEREARAKGMTPAAVRQAYELGTSLRTFVTPEDIANMAVFLASPAAARISGQVIAVDGHTENPDPKVG